MSQIELYGNVYNALMAFPSSVEVGCLLVGMIESQRVFVRHLSQKTEGSYGCVDIGSTADTLILLDKIGLDDRIVGWAHTHLWNNGHLYMSKTDFDTQQKLQKSQPDAVALIISQNGMRAYKIMDDKLERVMFGISPDSSEKVFLQELL